jgi:hypothetical protein
LQCYGLTCNHCSFLSFLVHDCFRSFRCLVILIEALAMIHILIQREKLYLVQSSSTQFNNRFSKFDPKFRYIYRIETLSIYNGWALKHYPLSIFEISPIPIIAEGEGAGRGDTVVIRRGGTW